MPTIDIPDKICSHCGGTRWYVGKNRKKYISYDCQKKKLERCRKSQKLHRDTDRNLKRKSLEQLDDRYIKSLICQRSNLSFNDVPQPLIELKRKQLLLKRQIKNNGKEKIN